MSKPGLIVHDTLTVKSQDGECRIQLCLGDITKLQVKDKVDVILVSAFQDNYAPVAGSVIHALWKNLSLVVSKLAEDKEEDLRSLYSCWWSKPLSHTLPYRRLLCFETPRNRRDRPEELVGHVFRCLVPVLKNKDSSVITPLLSTGFQHTSQSIMLEGMVSATVSWLKAGLPLRLLKIVIYADVEGDEITLLRARDDLTLLRASDDLFTTFNELKSKFEAAYLLYEEVTLEYDVYLSHSEEDRNVADQIRSRLVVSKPDIRVYTSRQKVDSKLFWQEQMFDVMKKCARVVAILSPNYLRSDDCIEQYNIALCCNRKTRRDMLAPFFVETTTLPTYMNLIQYIDCREDTAVNIASACDELIKSLAITDKVGNMASTKPTLYDVFVSYCRADKAMATPIVDALKKLNPELKVFYDIQELKQGHEWQRHLYHSIDGSSCMIAMISGNYLRSAVCVEEYSLAQAKHISNDKLHLIPLCIADDIRLDFSKVSHIPAFDARPGVYKDAVNIICSAIVSWLDTGSFARLKRQLSKNSNQQIDVLDLQEEVRSARFRTAYGNDLNQTEFPASFDRLTDESDEGNQGSLTEGDASSQVSLARERKSANVAFSYHERDIKYVHFLRELIQHFAPNVEIKLEFPSDQERLDNLEAADNVVALLSPHYIESPQHVEEFHIGLWRQRQSAPEAPFLLPIQVQVLPLKPTYFQVVDCAVSICDALWADLGSKGVTCPLEVHKILSKIKRSKLPIVSPGEVLPLTEAAQILMSAIKERRSRTTPEADKPSFRPALVSTVKLQTELDQLTGRSPKSLQEWVVPVPSVPESRISSSRKWCNLL